MKIVIGCDHGALALKTAVKNVLSELSGIEVEDIGTFTEDSVDYPDIAERLCARITSGEAERGVLLCGTGIGISIAANKIRGIRAALCCDVYSAKMARRHNDANVIALGGRVIGPGPAGEIVKAFMTESFEGGRHARRVGKITALENK
ncbi:MAG: ribose 5-phosphate isomerase B [Schwartzia sp.]|nr:ribose 5-phosphate isomerase B [Schwartzia sp. (in: firmicutes)]